MKVTQLVKPSDSNSITTATTATTAKTAKTATTTTTTTTASKASKPKSSKKSSTNKNAFGFTPGFMLNNKSGKKKKRSPQK